MPYKAKLTYPVFCFPAFTDHSENRYPLPKIRNSSTVNMNIYSIRSPFQSMLGLTPSFTYVCVSFFLTQIRDLRGSKVEHSGRSIRFAQYIPRHIKFSEKDG